MINVELSESEEVPRLKTEVFGTSNPDVRPSAFGLGLRTA
jgi:hypothetical protein